MFKSSCWVRSNMLDTCTNKIYLAIALSLFTRRIYSCGNIVLHTEANVIQHMSPSKRLLQRFRYVDTIFS